MAKPKPARKPAPKRKPKPPSPGSAGGVPVSGVVATPGNTGVTTTAADTTTGTTAAFPMGAVQSDMEDAYFSSGAGQYAQHYHRTATYPMAVAQTTTPQSTDAGQVPVGGG